jgi:hypothetical protein
MIALLYPAAAGAILGLVIGCPMSHRGRGRHISRNIGRLARLDKFGVMAVQTGWLVAEAAYAVFIGQDVTVLVMMAILIAWLLDDALTGGPDDRERKHEWARIKIRMPKPVKLRPAERVRAPVPA